jgi:hypothetical protein
MAERIQAAGGQVGWPMLQLVANVAVALVVEPDLGMLAALQLPAT